MKWLRMAYRLKGVTSIHVKHIILAVMHFHLCTMVNSTYQCNWWRWCWWDSRLQLMWSAMSHCLLLRICWTGWDLIRWFPIILMMLKLWKHIFFAKVVLQGSGSVPFGMLNWKPLFSFATSHRIWRLWQARYYYCFIIIIIILHLYST